MRQAAEPNLPALVDGIHVQAAGWAQLGHGHHIVAIAQARRCRLTHAAIEKQKKDSQEFEAGEKLGLRTLVQRGSDMQTTITIFYIVYV